MAWSKCGVELERAPKNWRPAYAVVVPVTLSVEDAVSAPPAVSPALTVEELWETNPVFKVARPWLRRAPPVVKSPEAVDEACDTNPPFKVARLCARRAPDTVKVEAAVDDAVAMKPPEASRVKRVVEALSWMRSAEPLWLTRVRSTRFVEAVEVAAMVAMEVTFAEVVPTARLSVKVVRWTTVPASVKPEVLPESASVPQMMLPEESVSRA